MGTIFIFNISYSQSFSVVSNIKIIGNKVTKDKIILRELAFQIGDSIRKDKAQEIYKQTKDNLLNTSLFNFVTVNPLKIDSIHATIYITVIERWYIWPIPVFQIEDTNFNTWLKDKDLRRIDFGLNLEIRNFRGRMEDLAFQVQFGYTSGFAIFYSKPYLNKKQNLGLSTQITYTKNHEISYNSSNDKRLYYSNDEDHVKREISAAVQLKFRQKLYNRHYVTLSYHDINLADSIRLLNPSYLENKNENRFFKLSYRFKHDKRDFANYPLKGHFASFKITKNGLGLANDKIDGWYFQSELKKFFQLPYNFYLSGNILGEYSYHTKNSYYLLPKLGFENYVRAYEYDVIAGQSLVVGKAQLRYGLLTKKIFQFNFFNSKQFNRVPLSIYPGIFYDIGKAWDHSNRINPLANNWIYGEGVSLDFVTYYDIVLRLEYSFNKVGESGFFIHFVAPI